MALRRDRLHEEAVLTVDIGTTHEARVTITKDGGFQTKDNRPAANFVFSNSAENNKHFVEPPSPQAFHESLDHFRIQGGLSFVAPRSEQDLDVAVVDRGVLPTDYVAVDDKCAIVEATKIEFMRQLYIVGTIPTSMADYPKRRVRFYATQYQFVVMTIDHMLKMAYNNSPHQQGQHDEWKYYVQQNVNRLLAHAVLTDPCIKLRQDVAERLRPLDTNLPSLLAALAAMLDRRDTVGTEDQDKRAYLRNAAIVWRNGFVAAAGAAGAAGAVYAAFDDLMGVFDGAVQQLAAAALPQGAPQGDVARMAAAVRSALTVLARPEADIAALPDEQQVNLADAFGERVTPAAASVLTAIVGGDDNAQTGRNQRLSRAVAALEAMRAKSTFRIAVQPDVMVHANAAAAAAGNQYANLAEVTIENGLFRGDDLPEGTVHAYHVDAIRKEFVAAAPDGAPAQWYVGRTMVTLTEHITGGAAARVPPVIYVFWQRKTDKFGALHCLHDMLSTIEKHVRENHPNAQTRNAWETLFRTANELVKKRLRAVACRIDANPRSLQTWLGSAYRAGGNGALHVLRAP